jgi:protein involved in sex pheromone biosynthesis
MKKAIIMLAVVVGFGFTACNNSSTDTTDKTADSVEATAEQQADQIKENAEAVADSIKAAANAAEFT